KQVPPWNITGAISFKAALTAGEPGKFAPVDVTPADVAFLQYTGGTTGGAKGAMLTHANSSANILQADATIAPHIKGRATLITPIPIYHIFALTANCLLFFRLGWRNILVVNPRDIPSLIKELKKYPFVFISGVNTLFNALLHRDEFKTVDFSQLQITLGG